jgi:uncharacterized protein (DUF362 family)
VNKVIINSFKEKTLDSIIESGFKAFDIDERLRSAKTVFIKPNLVSDVPEYIANGSNSDVRIIASVIRYLNKAYPKVSVYVGESDTGTKVKGRKLELALNYMGVTNLQKELNFKIINLTKDDKIHVKIEGGKLLKEIDMGKTLMDSDLIINIPKIKTHKYSTITSALKNMFGTIPDPLRIIYHENIHQVIADLNRLFYDKMFIVTDGIVGMEGSGPLFGTPVNLEVLLFADNPLFNDVVAANIMKIPISDIKHIQLVNGWANEDLSKISVEGNLELSTVARKFKLAQKNLFVKIEGKLMQHRWIVKILFNDWIRKNITYHISPFLKKLRGGSFSWYVEDKKNKIN